MTVNIGIYQKEEDVLEGVRLLREAGVDQGGIRIVVGNTENTPLITSNADVPIEELDAIQETRKESDQGIVPLGAVPLATGYPIGNTSIISGPAGVAFAGINANEGISNKELLKEIGISSTVAEECGKAVDSGSFLLLADTDSDINIESLLRDAGASNVIH